MGDFPPSSLSSHGFSRSSSENTSNNITMVKAKLAGMPKRPMSAYFLWMNDVGRAEVKKSNPGASITEVSKECGAAWQNIDPAVKAKYEKKKDEAKKAFDKNYAEWLADGGEELLAQQKKDKKAGKKPAKPAKKKTKKKKKAESSEDEKSASEAEDSDY